MSKADQINGSFRRQARECRRSTRFTKQVQAHKVWAAKKEGHSGMGIIILIGKSNLPLAEVLPTWSYAGRPFDMTLCMARQRRFLKKREWKFQDYKEGLLCESSRLTRSFRAAGVKTTQAKNDCSLVFLNYLQEGGPKTLVWLSSINLARSRAAKDLLTQNWYKNVLSYVMPTKQ